MTTTRTTRTAARPRSRAATSTGLPRLTARSVLLSVLLGTDPPRLPVQLLVRTTELFGISQGSTRTALSRMTAAGEIHAGDGWYELAAGHLVARQARQIASRAATTRPWRDGQWQLVIVGADGRRARDDRLDTRATLLGARFGELREGTWLRPDNLPEDLPGSLPADALDGALRFRAVPEDDPRELAARLWDLEGWRATAAGLRTQLDDLLGALRGGDPGALGPGFVLSAAVLRHFQHDPLLPEQLLPDGWPGTALRREYDIWDRAYRRLLQHWFASVRA